MSSEHHELLDQAIRLLRLRDIMLHQCRFERPAPPPLTQEAIEARQQSKRRVKFVVGEIPDDEGPKQILQVYVQLGMRVTGTQSTQPAPTYFEIEAEFLAEYDLTGELPAECLKAFANFNSVHNVWPFWRQHVFDTVSRGRLPHLDVPLFSRSSRLVSETSTDEIRADS